MTDIYLAWSTSVNSALVALDDSEVSRLNLLVTFVSMDKWLKCPAKDRQFAKTMLDSGAFSAYNSGDVVDIAELEAEVATGKWDESVALDVIGDAEASLCNAQRMAPLGSMPVFHIGDPWAHLAEYVAIAQKVGLSCRFGESTPESVRWLEQCFARAWPHQFHSFGAIALPFLSRFPFCSADESLGASHNWGCTFSQQLSRVPFPLRKRKGRSKVAAKFNTQKSTVTDIRAWLDYQAALKYKWQAALKEIPAWNI